MHHEYVPSDQTFNKEYYLTVIRRLRDAVRRKRPDLLTLGSWQIHHDNAPVHSSYLICNFLTKHSIILVRQAPYSFDIAPCDIWLFSKLKMPLKGTRFHIREDIIENATRQLNAIPKDSFKICFQT